MSEVKFCKDCKWCSEVEIVIPVCPKCHAEMYIEWFVGNYQWKCDCNNITLKNMVNKINEVNREDKVKK